MPFVVLAALTGLVALLLVVAGYLLVRRWL
jgi:hypothetical protein